HPPQHPPPLRRLGGALRPRHPVARYEEGVPGVSGAGFLSGTGRTAPEASDRSGWRRRGPKPFKKDRSTKTAVRAAGILETGAGGEGVVRATPLRDGQLALVQKPQGVTGELQLERLRALLHRDLL